MRLAEVRKIEGVVVKPISEGQVLLKLDPDPFEENRQSMIVTGNDWPIFVPD